MDRALKNLAAHQDLNIVLTDLKEQYIQGFTSSGPRDTTVREECYWKISTLDDLQTWVENHGQKR